MAKDNYESPEGMHRIEPIKVYDLDGFCDTLTKTLAFMNLEYPDWDKYAEWSDQAALAIRAVVLAQAIKHLEKQEGGGNEG